jgi:hypothetical protein
MPRVGVIIETPALVQVGMPIVTLAQYEVNRELNAAGSFAVAFPASEQLATQIKARWRVSLVEEGRPGYLLRRGIVIDHTYRISEDGTAVVALQGMSRLYGLMDESTHLGLSYDGTQDIGAIADDLTGESVTVPAGATTRKPKVTYNDDSKLAALLHALELARYNIRETFDEDGFELVSQDDVPDSGYRFVNVEQAGPEIEGAGANGMGLVAGAPTIGYSGKDLANRIIPVGVEWDGKALLLNASDKTLPYAIQTGTNPDSSSYYFIQDDDSVDEFGLVEMQYVRSDVKNPSDDAGTRLAAGNVLYALTAGEMLKRKSEVVSFSSAIANGYEVDALPGDRVRVQFRGTVRLANGRFTWKDIDKDFLVVKRRDASTDPGVRDVAFTLTAPEVPLVDLSLPDAVPIPPPPTPPEDPPEKPKEDEPDDPAIPDLPPDVPPGDPGLETPTDTGPQELAKVLNDMIKGIGPYQPCCAGPDSAEDGAQDPPTNGPSHWLAVVPLASTGFGFTQNDCVVAVLYFDVVDGAFISDTSDVAVTLLGAWTAQIGSGVGQTRYYRAYLLVPTGPSPSWVQDVNSFGTPNMQGGKYSSSAGVAGATGSVSHDEDFVFGAGPISASVSASAPTNKAGICIVLPFNGHLVSSSSDGVALGPGGGTFHVTVDDGGLGGLQIFANAIAITVSLP